MPGRDALDLLGFDWTPVVVAVVTLAGVVFNGCAAIYIATRLRTPSGTRIGKQVEDAHHVSLANHYRIRALASALGEPGEPDAPGEPAREA